MTTTVEVLYKLYEQPDPKARRFVPVTRQADRDIADLLEWADPLREVATHGNVTEQNRLLRDYVRRVPFELPAQGHVIDFDEADDSRWDEDSQSWVKTLLGGATAFPVQLEGSTGPARLHLAVWTRGATAAP